MRKRSLIIQAIIDAAASLKRMRISAKEILDGLIFPSQPFSRNGSKTVINAIKREDPDTVRKMIDKDKYLLYIHDNVKQTPLHWAAKRNQPEIIQCKTIHPHMIFYRLT